jgi:hypothetical protein
MESYDNTQYSWDMGESFYEESIKRIALPTDGIQTVQCWFLSGVYQMYKFDTSKAWVNFSHASAALSLVIKNKALCGKSDILHLQPNELCLYWTCWKSEWCVFPTLDVNFHGQTD